MEQLELFYTGHYSEQIELLSDIEYLEWLETIYNQNIERQQHEAYWQDKDMKLS